MVEDNNGVVSREPDKGLVERGFWRAIIKEIFRTFALVGVVAWGIGAFVARIEVIGPSMLPNLFNGEMVVVSRIAYWWTEPARGEVVVIWDDSSPRSKLIKRVVGVPGEIVTICDGSVFVDGIILDEVGYLDVYTTPEMVVEVLTDQYFVMGDNRSESSDSRRTGTIDRNNVIGKAVFVYWPLSAIGGVPHAEYGISGQ